MNRKNLAAASVLAFALLPIGAVEAQLSFCGVFWCSAVNYDVGIEPTGVVAGDFDGDRFIDLAVTSSDPGKVGILFNVGDGLFAAPVNVELVAGNSPHSLAAADFDRDGDLDLVVTRPNQDDVQILMNTAAAFSLGTITSVDGTDPRQVAAGDLDRNGFMDVVTVNRGSNSISVLFNSGGVLGAAVTYAVGVDPRGLALGYLDGDKGLDVAVASHGDRSLELFLNDGSGVFVAGSNLSLGDELSPEGVAIGDLDTDGDNDIAASTSGATGSFATVFLNSGSATFGAPNHHDSGGIEPSALVIADFDRSLGNDIAVAQADWPDPFGGDKVIPNVAVLLNPGGADFGTPRRQKVGASPQSLVVADLVVNGAAHLVTANTDDGNISTLKNNYVIFASGFEFGDTFPWSNSVPELP